MKFLSSSAIAILALATFGTGGPVHSAEPQQITMWSNWPDEPAKKDWVSARVHDFEASNPQCTVKLSFIPKADEYAQAKSAVRTADCACAYSSALGMKLSLTVHCGLEASKSWTRAETQSFFAGSSGQLLHIVIC